MVFANTFSGQNTPYSHPYFFSLPEFGSPNSLWPNYLSPLGAGMAKPRSKFVPPSKNGG